MDALPEASLPRQGALPSTRQITRLDISTSILESKYMNRLSLRPTRAECKERNPLSHRNAVFCCSSRSNAVPYYKIVRYKINAFPGAREVE